MKNSKKPIKSTVGLELLQIIKTNNFHELQSLVEQIQQDSNNQSNFNPIEQNLILAEYLLTKNRFCYLANLEKNNIQIQDLVQQREEYQNPNKTLNSLYILCNYIYTKNINPQSPSFSSSQLQNYSLDFSSACFKNQKFYRVPSFPFLKLFLSRMNHVFDNFEETLFLKNINNLHQFQIVIKNIEKTNDNKNQKFFVSPIYGAFFHDINNPLQNNFNKTELDILVNIIDVIKEIFYKDKQNYSQKLSKLLAKINNFAKEQESIDHDDKELLVNGNQKKQNRFYETKIFEKLCNHLRVLHLFFQIYGEIYFNENYQKAFELLFDPLIFCQEKNNFKTMYETSFQNLLSIINYKCKNYEFSYEVLKKSLTIFQFEKPIDKDVKDIDVVAECVPNNQMRINPVHLNLSQYAYKLKRYSESVFILSSRSFNFQNNYIYWYRLAMSHYQLFIQDVHNNSKKNQEEFQKLVKEDQKKFGYSKYTIRNNQSKNPVQTYFQKQFIKEQNQITRTGTIIEKSDFQNAIDSFNVCVQLIESQEDPENFKQHFSYLKKKKVDSNILQYQKLLNKSTKYLISCYEHLIYLFIQDSEYLKAQYCLNKVFKLDLNEKQKTKLLIYKMNVQQQIGQNNQCNEVIKILNEREKFIDTKFKCHYWSGNQNNFSLYLKEINSYNELVQGFREKNFEKLNQNIKTPENRDIIFDLNDFTHKPIYEKKLYWSYFSTYQYSNYQLKKISAPKTQNEKIL